MSWKQVGSVKLYSRPGRAKGVLWSKKGPPVVVLGSSPADVLRLIALSAAEGEEELLSRPTESE